MTDRQREGVRRRTYGIGRVLARKGYSDEAKGRLWAVLDVLEAVMFGNDVEKHYRYWRTYKHNGSRDVQARLNSLRDYVSRQERTNADERVLALLGEAASCLC